MMRNKKWQWVYTVGCLLALFSCGDPKSTEFILFDFESDAGLDRIHWKCRTLLSLSDKYSMYGARCLKMALFPSAYPGFAPMLKHRDSSAYGSLCFDTVNGETEPVPLTVRIDDREDFPDYADRFNKRYWIGPGYRQIVIPFAEMKTSGTGRLLDMKNVYRLLIFLVNPESKVTVYLDYIRLAP